MNKHLQWRIQGGGGGGRGAHPHLFHGVDFYKVASKKCSRGLKGVCANLNPKKNRYRLL